jgi:aspartate/methionine/tyrosine aminotransferase
MKLAPFLLDQWLNRYQFGDPPIRFDLATSTGPVWTLRQVLELADPDKESALFDSPLVYTDAAGSSELRSALALMKSVEPSHIQIFTGAEEAIAITFFLAAEPGANVIVPFPGFPPFEAIPKALGLEVRRYHLRAQNAFRVDPDEIIGLADANTKLILVNSPHNPTGSIMDAAVLSALHDFAAERGIQFVVDEVYHPIYHHDQPGRQSGCEPPSAVCLPHATVLGDLSKAFCLSGLRVGWVVERDRHRSEQYCDARSYFTVSNSPTTQILAAAAVEHCETIYARLRHLTTANLAMLDHFFSRLGDVLGWVRPEGGMTVFPWLLDGSNSRPMCERLAARGLLTAPGDCWDMPAHFRIGFGTIESGFSDCLDELERQIREYLGHSKARAHS